MPSPAGLHEVAESTPATPLSPGKASGVVGYLFVRSWVYHGIDSRLSGNDTLVVDLDSKGRVP